MNKQRWRCRGCGVDSTISWDDGDLSDVIIARVLAAHRYIVPSCPEEPSVYWVGSELLAKETEE